MSNPAITTDPEVGRLNVARMRIKVVLPAPLMPNKARNCPLPAEKLTPRNTLLEPNDLLISETVIIMMWFHAGWRCLSRL